MKSRFIQKAVGSILIFTMVVALLPAIAPLTAKAAIISGGCGPNGATNVMGSLDTATGVLTISGSGAMHNVPITAVPVYELIRYYPWNDYREDIKSVVIGSGVTVIGIFAFYDCVNLTSVTIPSSVTKIGDAAFRWCDNLSNVSIPNSVTSIGGEAFWGTNISAINLPSNLVEIGSGAFMSTPLAAITLPNGVVEIGSSAFYGTLLTEITIPANVTSIGHSAFLSCPNLRNVYFEGNAPSVYNTSATALDPENDSPMPISTFDASRVTLHYQPGKTGWSTPTWEGYNAVPTGGGTPPPTGNPVISYARGGTTGSVELSYSLDWYFINRSSTTYNTDIAEIAMAFSVAAYSESHLRDSFESCGFSTDSSSMTMSYTANDWLSYNPSYGIAVKTTSDNKKLVVIAIKGTDFDRGSDIMINAMFVPSGTGNHSGYDAAMFGVLSDLSLLLGGLPKDGNTRYLITGHSMGGAVANLLATNLLDQGVPKSCVFNYNFANPDATTRLKLSSWNPSGQYDSIFNVCNIRDVVPYLPNALMNEALKLLSPFWPGKNGRTLWFETGKTFGFDAHSALEYVNYLKKKEYPNNGNSNINYSVGVYPFGYMLGIFCPVDVEIIDSNGNVVARIINNQVQYLTANINDVLLFADNDLKFVLIDKNASYTIRLIGTGNGTMEYIAEDGSAGSDKLFDGVSLTNGKLMFSYVGGGIGIPDVQLIIVESGNVTGKILSDGTEIPFSNADALAADRAALTWGKIQGTNTALSSVTSDLSLPTLGAHGSTISWASSNNVIISDAGIVTRPASGTGNQTVALEATITHSGISDTVEFSLVVIGQSSNVSGDSDSDNYSPAPGASTESDLAKSLYYRVIARTLNQRFGPGVGYAILGRLTLNSIIEIVEYNDDKTWGKTSNGTWVSMAYLLPMQLNNGAGELTVNVNTGSRLNVRSGPSVRSNIVGRLPRGTIVRALLIDNDWALIEYAGGTAFASILYLK